MISMEHLWNTEKQGKLKDGAFLTQLKEKHSNTMSNATLHRMDFHISLLISMSSNSTSFLG